VRVRRTRTGDPVPRIPQGRAHIARDNLHAPPYLVAVDTSGRDPAWTRATDLPPLTPGSVAAFERSLSAITQAVSERYRIESAFAGDAPHGDTLEFLQDSHAHFGRTFLGICAFGLFDQLPAEAAWYAHTLATRGLGPPTLEQVLRSWTIAVLASLPPATAREVVRPLAWIEARVADLKPGTETTASEPGTEAVDFLDLIRRDEGAGAASVAVALLARGKTLEEVVDGVILASLVHVGSLWERNEISVADEHIATARIREAARRFFETVPRSPDRGARVVVACVPGNEHDLAPEIFTRYLEAKGWRAVFVGRSTPEGELVRTIQALSPQGAVLSIPLIAQLLPGLRTIERLRRAAPSVRVIVGGRAALIARGSLQNLAAVAGSFAQAERLLTAGEGGRA
jgi:methanogenic corrinoid protein MtbC1